MKIQDLQRILIIDNDEALVNALEIRLRSIGFDCVTAASGAQGLAAFDDQAIDLVITDLNMPAGDGVSLARSIRKESDVPIVMITGFRDAFRSRVRAVPGVTLLEKPFDTNELIDVVDAEIAFRHPRRRLRQSHSAA
jgi:two-component system response regulator MtrA